MPVTVLLDLEVCGVCGLLMRSFQWVFGSERLLLTFTYPARTITWLAGHCLIFLLAGVEHAVTFIGCLLKAHIEPAILSDFSLRYCV